MSEARKLLPCPFCGGTPMYCQNNEIRPDGEIHENYGGEWIECSACHACTNIRWPLMESVKELLAVAWNRRAVVKP